MTLFMPEHIECGGDLFRCTFCNEYVWDDRHLHVKEDKVADEPNIVELYGNSDSEDTSSIVVGFEEDKRAWGKNYSPDDEVEPDWSLLGSAVDYQSNLHFAELNGAPHKLR